MPKQRGEIHRRGSAQMMAEAIRSRIYFGLLRSGEREESRECVYFIYSTILA
jgi:hypothetical protein